MGQDVTQSAVQRLKRWLRTPKNGRLAIDRAKVKAEERLDGKYLLTSSDPHLPAEEIAIGYKALWKPSADSVI